MSQPCPLLATAKIDPGLPGTRTEGLGGGRVKEKRRGAEAREWVFSQGT